MRFLQECEFTLISILFFISVPLVCMWRKRVLIGDMFIGAFVMLLIASWTI